MPRRQVPASTAANWLQHLQHYRKVQERGGAFVASWCDIEGSMHLCETYTKPDAAPAQAHPKPEAHAFASQTPTNSSTAEAHTSTHPSTDAKAETQANAQAKDTDSTT